MSEIPEPEAHVTHNGVRTFGCSCGVSGPISGLRAHLEETGQHVERHGNGWCDCAWTSTLPAESEGSPTAAEIPAAEVHVTRYEVSCLPQGHREHKNFKVIVERHRGGMWSASDGLLVLAADGEWVTDPLGARHRHDEDTALQLAREAAPHMKTFNGHTVAEALQNQEIDRG